MHCKYAITTNNSFLRSYVLVLSGSAPIDPTEAEQGTIKDVSLHEPWECRTLPPLLSVSTPFTSSTHRTSHRSYSIESGLLEECSFTNAQISKRLEWVLSLKSSQMTELFGAAGGPVPLERFMMRSSPFFSCKAWDL